jgi:hypothetical protein
MSSRGAPRGTCITCGRRFYLLQTGGVKTHGPGGFAEPCEGSGMLPAETADDPSVQASWAKEIEVSLAAASRWLGNKSVGPVTD